MDAGEAFSRRALEELALISGMQTTQIGIKRLITGVSFGEVRKKIIVEKNACSDSEEDRAHGSQMHVMNAVFVFNQM